MLIGPLVVRIKINKGQRKPVKNVTRQHKRVYHLGKGGLLHSPPSAVAEVVEDPMGHEMARLGPEPGPGFLPYMQEGGLPKLRSSISPGSQSLETFLGSRPPWLSSLCAAARPRPLCLGPHRPLWSWCRKGGWVDEPLFEGGPFQLKSTLILLLLSHRG